MSFLFPANPADGDIVIQPQPDGTLIKGTYNATTNTWAVGELPKEPGIPGPPGPRGPEGPPGSPGQGVQISGVVATQADLPPAANHYLQFYIVDDTNTLYYSDGFQWYDLGSPIQGPAGADGADGTDGQDGALVLMDKAGQVLLLLIKQIKTLLTIKLDLTVMMV